ncbi:MAG: tetratricopeptide repeat protein [Candidatus Heimdallarchaeota archaeon]|nr:tetratricopeptide repeat protein [Candidatus Heimdallarchaeota archaeon]
MFNPTNALMKFTEVAISTQYELSKEERAEKLIQRDVAPHFITVLLEMTMEDIEKFVKKYDRKLPDYANKALTDLPKLHQKKHMIDGKKVTVVFNPDTETMNGYKRFLDAGKLPKSSRLRVFTEALSDFIRALKSDPQYVDALIGAGLVTCFVTSSVLEMIEWFARAYSLDQQFTLLRLAELNFYGIIQNLYNAIMENPDKIK